MPSLRHHSPQADPIRITTAAQSPAEELRGRQLRYMVSMTIRTLCFVGGVIVGAGWLRWVLIAGAVFLPYVAVVMANARPARREEAGLPGLGPVEPELMPGPRPSDRGLGQR